MTTRPIDKVKEVYQDYPFCPHVRETRELYKVFLSRRAYACALTDGMVAFTGAAHGEPCSRDDMSQCPLFKVEKQGLPAI